jgi:hypothetical protein
MATRVSGRDYLGMMVGSSGFQVSSWRINPGLPGVFNWLSRIAAGFEQYKFHKLVIVIETLTGTTVTGEIMIYVDYDSADPVPESARDFLTNSRAKAAPVWQERLEYAASSQGLNVSGLRYVRLAGIPADSDVLWFDEGIVHVGYDNLAASLDGVGIARVFVEYECELFAPHTDDLAMSNSHTYVAEDAAATGADPFGSRVVAANSDLPLIFDPANPTEILFPLPGFYLMSLDLVGTSPTMVVANVLDCEIEAVNDTAYTTVGHTYLVNVHVKEAGGIIDFTAGGTITATVLGLVKDAGTLEASHTVALDYPDFSIHRSKPREIDSDQTWTTV